jgi:sugar lactone lactonase YvrE
MTPRWPLCTLLITLTAGCGNPGNPGSPDGVGSDLLTAPAADATGNVDGRLADHAPDLAAPDLVGPDTSQPDATPDLATPGDATTDAAPLPAPTLTTLAGSSPQPGDGPALDRDFQSPTSVTVGADGVLVVADPPARRLRGIMAGGAAAGDSLVTLVGTGDGGYLDGPGAGAHMDIPIGLSTDGQGGVWLIDHDVVRFFDGGNITTIAGTMRMEGWRDGPADQVLFTHAVGLYSDPASGKVYIADTGNHRIRLLDQGQVTTLAGSTPGFADGPADQALFLLPTGIAVLPDGSVVITDANHRVRRLVLDADGPGLHRVSTLAGTGQPDLVDGPADQAAFSSPSGVAVMTDGTVLVADTGNHRVRRVVQGGQGGYLVQSVAGDVQGVADGPAATAALFDTPNGLTMEPSGSLLIVDSANGRLRRLTPGTDGDLASGTVTTVAGRGHFRDGAGAQAVLASPAQAALLPSGDLIFADGGNHRVRVVRDPFGTPRVETLAGDGGAGDRDGPALFARFMLPAAVAVAADGTVYVADTGNNRIRVLAPDAGGQLQVSTLTGTGGFGLQDGPLDQAELASPIALCLSPDGQKLYVGDFGNARIRLVDLGQGQVSTLTSSGQVLGVRQLALGDDGSLYLADSALGQIARRHPDGSIEVLASNLAAPAGVALVPSATAGGPPRILVSHTGHDLVTELTADGTLVPLAGSGDYGFADGPAAQAQLAGPAGLLWDGQRLIIADHDNARLRSLWPLPPPR